eukprot:Lankesteria_metandrocarpae@DN3287_c0_g1_i1.p1
MSPSRPEMLFKAQISEKAERYDDMVKWITEVVSESGGSGLSLEERNLLSVAYKNAVGQRRLSWRMVKQLEAKQKKRNNTAAENASADYRRGIETEISNLCNKLLGLLTTSLISTAKEPEDFVFYKKLYGDYNRYLAEFSDGQGRKDAIYNAGKSYEEAVQEANGKLKPRHPVRLGLELNLAVFTYEVLEKHSDAITLAEAAYHSAASGVTSDDPREATLIMQLLKDNIRVWKGTVM